VKHENPEMEQRKRELLEQEEQLKLQLTQLEEKLLLVLGNSQGNILENQVSFSSTLNFLFDILMLSGKFRFLVVHLLIRN